VAAHGRHRTARKLSRWALPSGSVTFLWLADDTPGGIAAFSACVALGVFLSVFYPVLGVLAWQAPGALVPACWRAWWRRGHPGRPHIPDWLRRAVYAADRRRCCYCGYAGSLQLDHGRPWSFGGRTSFWNLFTLCNRCNLVKSNYWDEQGKSWYRPFRGYSDIEGAAAILAFERRHRWSPLRLVRAAMAL
jgi:HNH endonuclease